MAKNIVKNINKSLVATCLLFGFLFFHFAKEMLKVKSDGFYVGQVNLYGDLVFHLGFINKFLETNTLLAANPYLPLEKPNYPIFADFLTAQIARIVGIDFSLFLTTFLMGLIIIFIARNFILNFILSEKTPVFMPKMKRVLSEDQIPTAFRPWESIKSDKIVFLALLLFFFNGGFGFYYFFQDFAASHQSFFTFITHMPNQYTDIKEKGYWWINTYLAYFLPQRGFLFAFPITLTILSLLYVGYKKSKRTLFFLAALLSGVLPLVQVHSLILLFMLSVYYSTASVVASKFKKDLIINWLIYAAVTLIIALPLFNSISSLQTPLKFIKFGFGWTSEENILWFWFKNLGLFAPLLIVSITWLFKKKFLFFTYLPFIFVFLICNLFIFQPWDFDNSKLLVYWYFASSAVVAYFLYDQFFGEGKFKKLIGALITLVLVFSGFLDIFRTFTPVTNYQIFSKNDLEVAQLVRSLTLKNALFVTASNHNHPIPALTGRSTLIGFHGWLWSHGLPYEQMAKDVDLIYLGGETAANLISKYKITYVTIGPNEHQEFQINENYFINYPSIKLAPNWEIYDVSNLWADSNRQN